MWCVVAVLLQNWLFFLVVVVVVVVCLINGSLVKLLSLLSHSVYLTCLQPDADADVVAVVVDWCVEESVYVCFCAFMMLKSAIFLIFLFVFFSVNFLRISSPLLSTLFIPFFWQCRCIARVWERATGDWFFCCYLEGWE